MNRSKFFLIVGALIILTPVFVYAQPRPPSVPVPLDGGLLALLAAGAVFGARKIKNTEA